MGAHITRPTNDDIGEKQPARANRDETGDNRPERRPFDRPPPDQEQRAEEAGHEAQAALTTAQATDGVGIGRAAGDEEAVVGHDVAPSRLVARIQPRMNQM